MREVIPYRGNLGLYGLGPEHLWFNAPTTQGVPTTTPLANLPPVQVGEPPGLSAFRPGGGGGGSIEGSMSSLGGPYGGQVETGPTVGGLYGNQVTGQMSTGFPAAVNAGVVPGTPGNWATLGANLLSMTSPLNMIAAVPMAMIQADKSKNDPLTYDPMSIPSPLGVLRRTVEGLVGLNDSFSLDDRQAGLLDIGFNNPDADYGAFGYAGPAWGADLGVDSAGGEFGGSLGNDSGYGGAVGSSGEAGSGYGNSGWESGGGFDSGGGWGDSGGGGGWGGDSGSGSDGGGWASGGLIRGPGGGLDDLVPAVINGQQPARLSNGEFVVPASAVKAFGNGSTIKGAQRLTTLGNSIQRKGFPRGLHSLK